MLKHSFWKKVMNLSFDELYQKAILLTKLNDKVIQFKQDRDFENFKIYRRQRNSLSEELKSLGMIISEQ